MLREQKEKAKEERRKKQEEEKKKIEEMGKNAERRVEIRAIEFDWLFSQKEGEAFMKELSETSNIDLFSQQIIKYIVLYQWKYFKYYIILRIFVPFMAYFLLFLAYSTYTLHDKIQKDDTGSTEYIVNLVMIVITFLLWCFFSYIEVRQM